MPGTIAPPSVQPIPKAAGSDVDFGAIITGLDIENLTEDDFDFVRDTLYKNHVVVVKSHPNISPKAQYELTRRFDPSAQTYGHGKTLDAKRSVLHPDLKTVPHQPQVQVIGNGFVDSYEGLEDIRLRHPHHKTFHKTKIPEAEDLDYTRFYRWHIDAALYDLNPPRVTSLLAVRVPKGRRQTCRYDDGTGETLDVPLGTTAFVSGYRMYDLLSEEDKEFVRTSRAEYAPHPYIWMSSAASRSTGLGMISEGKELPSSELPPIEEEKIKILPMCWKNPVTGDLALQVHPSAVRKIHLKDGTIINDLEKVRDIVYRLQRPAISPQYVYPHDWEEGDLVLFNNQGVIHSVVGAFAEDEVRLFRQCNMAAGDPPLGPDIA
ncbi:Clavaminate synthase-like protein [Saccharata proteae CBS 121410]|uniref:Clavaminate synthase-like protein n=1 Tax=Saccharata proteae CBS 121410 TaxID=1314787 RepID=A0A9P4LYW4_9PEZI|nr:Clavaminate synthase-like protein [Saccharata proteae CBS 121410]